MRTAPVSAEWLVLGPVWCLVIYALVALCPALPLKAQTIINAAAADYGTTVFAYFRIGEDAAGRASTSRDEFQQHLAEIDRLGLRVVSLETLIADLEAARPSPDGRIAITIDDVYRSALETAVPALLDAGHPVTVFVTTSYAGRGRGPYADWAALRALRTRSGGLLSFGLKGRAPRRLPFIEPQQRRRELAESLDRFRAELGTDPVAFAYPYGLFDSAVEEELDQAGIRAAFGQHAGVVGIGSDRLALPRFTMAGSEGNPERFRLASRALPYPMRPVDPVIKGETLTVHPLLTSDVPSCFLSDFGAVAVAAQPDALRIDLPDWPAGKAVRLNCTLREERPGETARWRWAGAMLLRPVQ